MRHSKVGIKWVLIKGNFYLSWCRLVYDANRVNENRFKGIGYKNSRRWSCEAMCPSWYKMKGSHRKSFVIASPIYV